MTDRNTEYMREMWGTTKLVTDYASLGGKKLLREVTTEKYLEESKEKDPEIFDSWEYGLETFPINK